VAPPINEPSLYHWKLCPLEEASAVSVNDSPEQIALSASEELIVVTGNAFTVTSTSSVFTQPFASVPVTVYVLVTVGVNATPLLIELFQLYVLAPDPLKVMLLPLHIVWSAPALTEGNAFTVTVTVAEQPFASV
jgi:hypothetical protein